MGLDLSLMPSNPKSLADYDDWKAAAKGQSCVAGINNRELPDGTQRTEFKWAAASAGAVPEEEEAAPPPPPKKGGAKGASGKKR